MKSTRAYVEALTEAISQGSGITFKEGKTWGVDVTKRELTYNPIDLVNSEAMSVKGLIIHEAGHLLHTTDTPETTLQKKYPIMQLLYNACEDIRIEDKQMSKYGDWGAEGLSSIFADTLEKYISQGLPAPKSPVDTLLHVLCGILNEDAFSGRKQDFLYEMDFDSNDLHIRFSHDVRTRIAKSNSTPTEILYRSRNAVNTKDLKYVVDTYLFPILKDLIEKIPPQDQVKAVAQMKEQEAEERRTHYAPAKMRPETDVLPPDKEIEALYGSYSRVLASKLKDVLKELRSTKYLGQYKRGKLLSKNTYKVITDEPRMFSRRNTPNVPDYNIIFVLDESGSMNGTKHKNSYIGAFVVEKAAKLLKFPFHGIKFNESVMDIGNSIKEYRKFRSGDNNDADALRMAIKKLDPDRENIVFVFSDGGIGTDVKPPLKTLKEKHAIVIPVGIGIRDNELKKAYGDNVVNVPDVTKLPNVLINILKTIIHR